MSAALVNGWLGQNRLLVAPDLRCGFISRRNRGSLLFEVVLALALFATAVVVVTGGLNAAMRGVERARLNAHAVDLAVSVISELQIGVRPFMGAGPEPFEAPFEQWNWEIQLTPMDGSQEKISGLTKAQVIIRHEDPPVTYRLTEVVPTREISSSPDDIPVQPLKNSRIP